MSDRTTYASNLMRIASSIEEEAPFLSYELGRSVRRMVGDHARISVMNPGVRTWEEHVEQMVAVLKSLDQELDAAVREAETVEDLKDLDKAVEEFSILFQETEEEKKLREYLDNTKLLGKTASSTAGVKDFLKNIWKSVTKGDEPEGADAGMAPSYTLDEGTLDDIVEGKADWADASYYIEEEFRENKDFFDGAAGLLDQMKQVREAYKSETLDLGALGKLKSTVQVLIRHGQNMLRGIKKHLLEPAPQVTLEEDEEPAKGATPSGPDPLWDLESTVEHYVDVLRESLGDEGKTVSLLKELFKKVEPAIGEERAEISFASRMAAQRRVLPALIRLAYSRPNTRPVLLPIIRQAVGR